MGHNKYLMNATPISAKDLVGAAMGYYKVGSGLLVKAEFTEKPMANSAATRFMLEITSPVARCTIEHIDWFWQDRSWMDTPSHDKLAMDSPDKLKYIETRKADIEEMLYNKFLLEAILHGLGRLVGPEALTSASGQLKHLNEFYI